MKIISGLKWNDDLLNKTSLFYKNETVKIVVEVIRCFLLYQQILRISVNYQNNDSSNCVFHRSFKLILVRKSS
jgi:hypothetical protein